MKAELPQKDEGYGLCEPRIGEESPHITLMIVRRPIRIVAVCRILVIIRGLGCLIVVVIVVMLMIVMGHMKHRLHIFQSVKR